MFAPSFSIICHRLSDRAAAVCLAVPFSSHQRFNRFLIFFLSSSFMSSPASSQKASPISIQCSLYFFSGLTSFPFSSFSFQNLGNEIQERLRMIACFEILDSNVFGIGHPAFSQRAAYFESDRTPRQLDHHTLLRIEVTVASRCSVSQKSAQSFISSLRCANKSPRR